MNNQPNGNNQNNYYGNQPNGIAPDGYYNNQPYGNNPNGYYNQQNMNNPYNDYTNLNFPNKAENTNVSKAKWKKRLEIILSIVTFIFIIFAINKIQGVDNGKTTIQTYSNSTASNEAYSNDTDYDETYSNNTANDETNDYSVINSIGDSVVTDNVKFTLTELYKTGVIRGEYYNKSASEGNIFLVLGFEVENVGYDNKFVSIGFFEASLDRYMIDWAWVSNLESFSGDISPNSKRKGYVVYEVPENWNNLEIHYSESYGADFYCSFAYNDIGY